MPRSGSVSSSRPAHYDRNPVSILVADTQFAIAPHAFTTRDSYTVPEGRKAIVESVAGEIVRITAASVADFAQLTATITPNGGQAINTLQMFLFDVDNAIGDRDRLFSGTSETLAEGDEVAIRTRDNSTGGTITYTMDIKLTEFDS